MGKIEFLVRALETGRVWRHGRALGHQQTVHRLLRHVHLLLLLLPNLLVLACPISTHFTCLLRVCLLLLLDALGRLQVLVGKGPLRLDLVSLSGNVGSLVDLETPVLAISHRHHLVLGQVNHVHTLICLVKPLPVPTLAVLALGLSTHHALHELYRLITYELCLCIVERR